jgi:hypothetical protein
LGLVIPGALLILLAALLLTGRIIVRDHNGAALAYFYDENEPGRRPSFYARNRPRSQRAALVYVNFEDEPGRRMEALPRETGPRGSRCEAVTSQLLPEGVRGDMVVSLWPNLHANLRGNGVLLRTTAKGHERFRSGAA